MFWRITIKKLLSCLNLHFQYIILAHALLVILFIWYIIDKDMLPKAYIFIYLFLNGMRTESTNVFQDFYGIQTDEYPKSSCHEIATMKSKIVCLGTCVTTMYRIIMISYDEATKTCMCCSYITGENITGPNWKSYVPLTCKYFFYQIKVLVA